MRDVAENPDLLSTSSTALNTKIDALNKKMDSLEADLKGIISIDRFEWQIFGDDIKFMELPDFFIKRDDSGPYLEVLTEEGVYVIRLEKK